MDSSKHGNGTIWRNYRKMMRFCGNMTVPKKCMRAIAGVAVGIFRFLRKKEGMQFTGSELWQFKKRFVKVLKEHSKRLVAMRAAMEQYREWKRLCYWVYEYMKPTVTRALVDEVNRQGLGWEAHYRPAMADSSRLDAVRMTGLELSAAEAEQLLRETRGSEADDLLEVGRAPEPQGPFDGREAWPACRAINGHVRYQDCQNCWSHAVAFIAESRVCIATGGRLQGSDAWLSQSYIAMCRTDGRDYCAGASGAAGFLTINKWGLPTGAPNDKGSAPPGIRTCVPQVQPNVRDARCPGSCTREDYPRSLENDLFFPRFTPRSFSPRGSQTLHLAKRSMLEEGPILIGLTVYTDFWAYHNGIYNPVRTPTNRNMGGHAVTGMGFGPGYFLCINSWGPTFGDKGAFKVAPEALNLVFVMPGKVSDSDYPTPVP